jgi:hypothetical protein
MRQEETLYTMKEIELATGIKTSTLQGRKKRLGINSSGGYTLAEVKQMIKRPVPGRYKASRRKAEALKAMLKNDGAL